MQRTRPVTAPRCLHRVRLPAQGEHTLLLLRWQVSKLWNPELEQDGCVLAHDAGIRPQRPEAGPQPRNLSEEAGRHLPAPKLRQADDALWCPCARTRVAPQRKSGAAFDGTMRSARFIVRPVDSRAAQRTRPSGFRRTLQGEIPFAISPNCSSGSSAVSGVIVIAQPNLSEHQSVDSA